MFPRAVLQPSKRRSHGRDECECQQGRGHGVASRQLDAALPERRRPGLDRVAGEKTLKVLDQSLGRAIAPGRLLVEAVQADGLEVAGDPGYQPRRRHDLVVSDLTQRLHRRFPLEWRTAGQHFVEDRAQRIDVGGRPDILGMSARLFGGHVAGRAHDLAQLGLTAVRFEPLGQAEIGDLGDAILGEQNVGGLQIAVDDSGVVGELDGPGERDQELGGRAAGLGRTCEPVIERAPLEQLEGNEGCAGGFADLEDLNDVGMTQPGDRLGLDEEPGLSFGATGPVPADHLHGNQAIQSELPRLVDDAHASLAEHVKELVAGDRR